MSKNVIVVGGGQAAASFAAKLRQMDQDCSIRLYCEEPTLPYQRPPLSKKYATGDMTSEQLLLRPADWYEQNNIGIETGSTVSKIDVENKTIETSGNSTASWDTLMLATGSSTRSLPAAIGGTLKGVYLLRSIADADNFAGELVEGKKVLIVGGGYIGLEAAAVCVSWGLQVTLIEAADRILQRVACAETSTWFKGLHKDNGVNLLEGVGLERITEANGQASGAVLSNGEEIEADFVVVGIGIIPNTALAEQAGITVDNGIVVNGFCQTSNPDVYAAGDCAVFDYKGQQTRLESVQNAIDQAECAARNIAGEPSHYAPYPWFWSDQYNIKLQIAGLNRGYDQIVVRPGERDGTVSHFYFSGETFLSVDSMNDPRTYMVCKKMLEAGKNITPAQAADTNLILKSLL